MIKRSAPSLDDVLIEYELDTIERDLDTALYSFTLTSVVLYGVDLTHRFHDWSMSEDEFWEHVYGTLNELMERLS